MTNKPGFSTGPHVRWLDWGAEAFAEAQRSNKPIHLSISYSACHSCRVMERESFKNPATAALLNELFVNIKVDRDQRPEIDHLYQSSVKLLGEPGGWPLTMFLTPSGAPYAGGTYFPDEARPGRPSLVEVANEAARMFREAPDQVAKTTVGVQEFLERFHNNLRPISELSGDVLDVVAKHICMRFDVFHGGLIGVPKFPNPALLELLWRAYLRKPLHQYIEAVENSLLNICQGGIYDHLGGGFARYATDERWMLPRFEKMLCDNARMIDVLTLVWQRDQRPLYRVRVEETITWALRELANSAGGFASSLDAESGGEEGQFYLWSKAEVDAALGKDAAQFELFYDVRAEGNWRGLNILHRLNKPEAPAETEGRLNAMRARLKVVRDTRPRPEIDDTVLTAWNGLMISALAQAATVFNRVDWQAAAAKAFWFVADTLSDGDRIAHSWREGEVQRVGLAEDYANLARAAVTLYETTGHRPYLERARAWVGTLDASFWRPDIQGYSMTADDAEPLLVRPRTVFDDTIPSVNATMVDLLTRLYYLTGAAHFQTRANTLIAAFAHDALQSPPAAPTFFNGLDTFLRGTQIIIAGSPQDGRVLAFRDVLRRISMPEKIVTILAPGEQLAEGHPARAMIRPAEHATVYLCRGSDCSTPITQPAELEMRLKTRISSIRANAPRETEA